MRVYIYRFNIGIMLIIITMNTKNTGIEIQILIHKCFVSWGTLAPTMDVSAIESSHSLNYEVSLSKSVFPIKSWILLMHI